MNFLNPYILARNIFHLIIVLIFSHSLASQILPNRYVDQIFTSTVETKNILFSTHVPQPKPGGSFCEFLLQGLPTDVQENNFDLIDLKMDVFEPQGDTMTSRPLIIIAFGGGFVDNDRSDWAIRLLAENLTKQGFVTASIDYRKGMKVSDMELSKRAVYRGVQDARSAVRFFKHDASTVNTFRIDTNLIFMGGHSSGGFIALHNAYMDKITERPVSTFDYPSNNPVYPDLGCLDCVGDNLGYSGNVKSIFNLAGAIGDTIYMENSLDIPIISFHSTDDGTVPYYVGEPLSYLNITSIFGCYDLPEVYGMDPIHIRADNVNIKNTDYSYTNRGHDVHHNGISLYPEIVPNISMFFYDNCLIPEDLMIIGNQVFCTSDNVQNYQAIGGNPKYYEWEITGGTILNPGIYSSSAEISWDPLASLHELKVTPYSSNGARGNLISMPINITSGDLVEWTAVNGDWDDESNWNFNRTPLSCDDVLINTAVAMDVMVFPGTTIEVKSLTLQGPVNMSIPSSSVFRINND